MRVVLIGEAMVELSRAADGWHVGYGGDTLNTALHLARLGSDVTYVTALGADPFSDELRAAWAAEGLNTALILTDPKRVTGLYAITTDAVGERKFTYWRGESAARTMFALPDIEKVLAAVEQAELLVYSLISLAILPPEGRAKLIGLARRVRERGGRVVFDGNYRPALWTSVEEAQAARDAAIAACDIGLPTLEDEIAMSGDSDASAVAARWIASGAREVIVKLGPDGCLLGDGTTVSPPAVLKPVDTSGAGDAFNAGYLHACLAGKSPAEAALAGHVLAGWVVMQRGAVPVQTSDAPYAAGLRA